jgi:regulator of nucleoside diphosphate kinase
MQTVKQQLVLRNDDYEIMLGYLKGGGGKNAFDRRNAKELEEELRKARRVNKETFPGNVVRLNSKVKVKEETNDKVMELTLVIPEKANIREGKISIMAPIGTALLGFSEGSTVKWQVPSGKKIFTILEVKNEGD